MVCPASLLAAFPVPRSNSQSAGLFLSDAMFGSCTDIVFVLTCVNTLGTLLVMGIMLYVNGRWKCDGRMFVAIGFLARYKTVDCVQTEKWKAFGLIACAK